MDNYTRDLLKAWDCDHLIDSFRDARIDAVALGLLKENDIISLIPIIGDRLKFEANLSMWKADNNSVVEGSESANISLSNIINDLEGPEELVNKEVDQERNQADREKIQTILQKSHRGRALLTAGSGGLLDSSQRKELGNLILDHELEQNPNVQLKWAQFQSWSRGICELFTKESPVLYYTSYVAAGAFQAKRNASGILYNTYLRKRKNLIKKKVTTPFRKRASTTSSDSSDFSSSKSIHLSVIDEAESSLVEEALLSLTIAVEGTTPWNEIEILWKLTAKARLQKLYNEKGTLVDYYNEYQVLKGPNGYKLLMADFEQLYPAAAGSNLIRSQVQNLSEKIIDKGKTLSTKDQYVQSTLNELLNCIDDDPEKKTNVCLLLLPLLMNITPLRGKGVKKVSKAIIQDNFILRVSTGANLEARLQEHKDALRSWKLTFQPIVVYIGETITSFEKCYVIVEDTRYELPNLVAAVDTAFKLYQATAAEYPILAYDVWYFIQRAIYDVKTSYDLRMTQSVKTFLVDLGLKEKC